jgi:hypothetical protein
VEQPDRIFDRIEEPDRSGGRFRTHVQIRRGEVFLREASPDHTA